MSDPFLSLPGTKRKRPSKPERKNGVQSNKADGPAKGAKRRLREPSPVSEDDDEVASDVEMEEPNESEESDIEETPAERRLRLAKEYLENVKNEVGTLPYSISADRKGVNMMPLKSTEKLSHRDCRRTLLKGKEKSTSISLLHCLFILSGSKSTIKIPSPVLPNIEITSIQRVKTA